MSRIFSGPVLVLFQCHAELQEVICSFCRIFHRRESIQCDGRFCSRFNVFLLFCERAFRQDSVIHKESPGNVILLQIRCKKFIYNPYLTVLCLSVIIERNFLLYFLHLGKLRRRSPVRIHKTISTEIMVCDCLSPVAAVTEVNAFLIVRGLAHCLVRGKVHLIDNTVAAVIAARLICLSDFIRCHRLLEHLHAIDQAIEIPSVIFRIIPNTDLIR